MKYLPLITLFSLMWSLQSHSKRQFDFEYSSNPMAFERLRLDSNAYLNAMGRYMEIGQCANTSTKTCDSRLVPSIGKSTYYYWPKTDLSYKRVESAHQGTSILSIGISVGASTLFGILGASISVKGTTTLKMSSSCIILMAKLDYTKGVITLSNTGAEITDLNENLNDKYYVSDILLGTVETMYVKLEFESWQKKTEIEVKIKVKILFFSISATMKFISESGDASGSVEVVRISSYRNSVDRKFFQTGSYVAAIKHVEAVEKEFSNLPQSLKNISNENLHRLYSLLPFKRDYKNYISDSAVKFQFVRILLNHRLDATDAIDYIDTLNQARLSDASKSELLYLKNEARMHLEKLNVVLESTFKLNDDAIRLQTDNVIRGQMPHHYKTKYFTILNNHNIPY